MSRSYSLFITCCLLLVCCFSAKAQLSEDKTYRIVPVAASSMSLMVQNSKIDNHSADNPVNVVLWDETDVASQQWRLAFSETYTFITNIYSNKIMSATAASAGAEVRQSRSGAPRWALEAVDEAAGTYKIKNNSKDLYLTAKTCLYWLSPLTTIPNSGDSWKWNLRPLSPRRCARR